MRSVLIATTDSDKEQWNPLRSDLTKLLITHELHRIDIDGKSLEEAVARAEKIHVVAILASMEVDPKLPDIIARITHVPVIGVQHFNNNSSTCPVIAEDDVAKFIARMLYPYNLKVKKLLTADSEESFPKLYSKHLLSVKNKNTKIKFISVCGNNALLYNDENTVRCVSMKDWKHISELEAITDGIVSNISLAEDSMGVFTDKHNLYISDLSPIVCLKYRYSYLKNCILSILVNKTTALYFCKNDDNISMIMENLNKTIKTEQVLPYNVKKIIPSLENNIILMITNDDQLLVFDMDKKVIWDNIYGWNPEEHLAAVIQCVINKKYFGILGINSKDEVYSVNIFDTNNYKIVFSYSDFNNTITCFDINSEKDEVFIASLKELTVYDIIQGQALQTIKYTDFVTEISVSKDGAHVATLNNAGDLDVLI